MNFLSKVIFKLPEYQYIQNHLSKRTGILNLNGLSNVTKAHMIQSICLNNNKKALLIASDEAEANRILNDLNHMGIKSLFYSIRDFNFRDFESSSREYEQQRLNVLAKIISSEYDVVISCIEAAVQYTIPVDKLISKIIRLKKGQNISISSIEEDLIKSGYERYDQVESLGQFSVRGGILDFFTPGNDMPVRVEFFGDEIDTISHFDSFSQRRIDSLEEIFLVPATEVMVENKYNLIKKINLLINSLDDNTFSYVKKQLLNEIEALKDKTLKCLDKFIPLIYKKTTLFDYINKDNLIFISEPAKCLQKLKNYNSQWIEDFKEYLKDGTLCKGLDKFSEDEIYYETTLEKYNVTTLDTFTRNNESAYINSLNIQTKNIANFNGNIKLMLEELRRLSEKNATCVILCGTNRAAQAIANDLIDNDFRVFFSSDKELIKENQINVMSGNLSSGFCYPNINFYLLSNSLLVDNKSNKKAKKVKNSKQINSLSEIKPGDYVVHSSHGIGIFQGIHKLNSNGITKDYLKLNYAKGDVLYVPVTQLDMVSKYIGKSESSGIKLNRLGGSEWQKTKKRVNSCVKDIAKELISLYSERMKAPGHAFPEDDEWQRDFESRFEYDETDDQIRCIAEIKADMEKSAPMDRLLCGDVGFGKTEVALRAAFKCITDSMQCAFLVPTTILAWQHYQNILKRFEGFPISIELLSRFKTTKHQSEIIKKLKKGEVDLIVGTHRLVQKDVKFRNLGLVIIDEEQRFGVAQKEKFKEITKNVDVLTLSATPIPRTLNMAMSGIRDMSSIEEAPQDRKPVQTYVLEHDQHIINEAIKRELRRGGQVYYIHNQIESIYRVANLLQSEMKDVKIGIGHGKMSENELSKVWKEVIEHKIDILVCTTIIETGVDVPNVNTIIIDNADKMGLSQLHQLRGRVGRSSRRAYAYLTFKKDKVLSEISEKRLSAIKEFTEFGSGFKIAMRDLELRGAGNILGGEQHGHMESVGYDLYIKLLNNAINEQKGEENQDFELECLIDIQVEAYIPETYISNLSQRISIYRRIADIRNQKDVEDVLDELIDRFGEPPECVNGLIDIAFLKSRAAFNGVYEIKQQENNVFLYMNKMNMELINKALSLLKDNVKIHAANNNPYIEINVIQSKLIKTLKDILT